MMAMYLNRGEFIKHVHQLFHKPKPFHYNDKKANIRLNYEHCYLLAKDDEGIRIEATMSAAGECDNLRIEEPCGFYLDTSLPLSDAYLKACNEHTGDIYLVERNGFHDEELEDRPVFDDFLTVEPNSNEKYYMCDDKEALLKLSKESNGLYYVFTI